MNVWLAGARPKTLPVAVSPVLIATAIVARQGEVDVIAAVLCAVVALLFQVGVNYANDYSDGIRGTDENRHITGGPVRLVGQGLVAAPKVKRAAWMCFALACVIGAMVAVATDHYFLFYLGAAAVPAAWLYTGGSKPYGYMGLGELSVFIFFGLVAVLGTGIAQTGNVTLDLWSAAVGQGCIASAVLVANNLRDIPTDKEAGKRTLAVRIGDSATRWLYAALIAAGTVGCAGAVLLGNDNLLQALGFTTVAALFAWGPVAAVLKGANGRDLVATLAFTGRYMLLLSVFASVCLLASTVVNHVS